MSQNYPEVILIKVQATDFHLAAARNAGAAAVTSPWVAFVDVDIELAPNFFEILANKVDPNYFYLSKHRADGMAGFNLCESSAFRRVGGYDHRIKNYGREDTDLVWALIRSGVQGVWLDGRIGQHHEHSNESRTRYLAVKDIGKSYRANDAYLVSKWGGVYYPTTGWKTLTW